MMKRLVLAVLLVFSVFSTFVMADDTDGVYSLDGVYINDMDLEVEELSIYVERGDAVELEIYLTGIDDGDDETTGTADVNVRAWIGGYEYGSVEVASEMFEITEDVYYKKTLSLDLPEDLEAEQTYTLYVEIYDDTNSETLSGDIMVSKVRHLLDIQDVVLDSSVDAGDYTTAIVRLENMGDHKEEDIKVTVSIPALGIEKSTFLDELTNDEIDNEDEEDSGDVSLTFQIPEDAESGDYEVLVSASYNNGYDTIEETDSISVEATAVEETEEDSTVTVVVDETEEEAEESTDFSTALRLGFGILAVLIVILALILIVRR